MLVKLKTVILKVLSLATDDAYDATSASVSYAAAAGVTAIIGYTTVDLSDEGSSVTDSGGSAWYIGANLAF